MVPAAPTNPPTPSSCRVRLIRRSRSPSFQPLCQRRATYQVSRTVPASSGASGMVKVPAPPLICGVTWAVTPSPVSPAAVRVPTVTPLPGLSRISPVA